MLEQIILVSIGKTQEGCNARLLLVAADVAGNDLCSVFILHQRGDEASKGPLVVIIIINIFTIKQITKEGIICQKVRPHGENQRLCRRTGSLR